MLSGCAFLEVDSLTKDSVAVERVGGVSLGLIWPHFVGGHAEAVYRPEDICWVFFFVFLGDRKAQRKHW